MRTTIAISTETKERIKKLGKFGETHEDVVKRGLECLENKKEE